MRSSSIIRPPRPLERLIMSFIGMLIGRLLVEIIKHWSIWREEADAMRWIRDLAYVEGGRVEPYRPSFNQHQYYQLDGYWAISGPPSTAMEIEYRRRYGAKNPELN